MIQDFPHANARLAEVARHWADGEVSHETWRRERRNILRELCTKRTDCQERPPLLSGLAPRASAETAAAVAAPPITVAAPAQPAVVDSDADVAHEEVLTLALILAAVVVGAVLVFFLA